MRRSSRNTTPLQKEIKVGNENETPLTKKEKLAQAREKAKTWAENKKKTKGNITVTPASTSKVSSKSSSAYSISSKINEESIEGEKPLSKKERLMRARIKAAAWSAERTTSAKKRTTEQSNIQGPTGTPVRFPAANIDRGPTGTPVRMRNSESEVMEMEVEDEDQNREEIYSTKKKESNEVSKYKFRTPATRRSTRRSISSMEMEEISPEILEIEESSPEMMYSSSSKLKRVQVKPMEDVEMEDVEMKESTPEMVNSASSKKEKLRLARAKALEWEQSLKKKRNSTSTIEGNSEIVSSNEKQSRKRRKFSGDDEDVSKNKEKSSLDNFLSPIATTPAPVLNQSNNNSQKEKFFTPPFASNQTEKDSNPGKRLLWLPTSPFSAFSRVKEYLIDESITVPPAAPTIPPPCCNVPTVPEQSTQHSQPSRAVEVKTSTPNEPVEVKEPLEFKEPIEVKEPIGVKERVKVHCISLWKSFTSIIFSGYNILECFLKFLTTAIVLHAVLLFLKKSRIVEKIEMDLVEKVKNGFTPNFIPPCFEPSMEASYLIEVPDRKCDDSSIIPPCPSHATCSGGFIIECDYPFEISQSYDDCIPNLMVINELEELLVNKTSNEICSSLFFHLRKEESPLFETSPLYEQLYPFLDENIFEKRNSKIGLTQDYIKNKLSVPFPCYFKFAVVNLSMFVFKNGTTIMKDFIMTSPLTTLIILVLTIIINWIKNKRRDRKQERALVEKTQNMVYSKLQELNEDCYQVTHLRDTISHELFPSSLKERQKFSKRTWHKVMGVVKFDSRVKRIQKNGADCWEWSGPKQQN